MKSIIRKLTMENELGLHMRPAAEVTKIARCYKSTISFRKIDDIANAGSIVELMLLSVAYGDTLDITAVGDDAEEALDAICEYLDFYSGKDLYTDNINVVINSCAA